MTDSTKATLGSADQLAFCILVNNKPVYHIFNMTRESTDMAKYDGHMPEGDVPIAVKHAQDQNTQSNKDFQAVCKAFQVAPGDGILVSSLTISRLSALKDKNANAPIELVTSAAKKTPATKGDLQYILVQSPRIKELTDCNAAKVIFSSRNVDALKELKALFPGSNTCTVVPGLVLLDSEIVSICTATDSTSVHAQWRNIAARRARLAALAKAGSVKRLASASLNAKMEQDRLAKNKERADKKALQKSMKKAKKMTKKQQQAVSDSSSDDDE